MFQFATTKIKPFAIWKNGLALYKNTFSKVWYLMFIPLVLMSVLVALGLLGFFLEPNIGKDHPIFSMVMALAVLVVFLLVLFYVLAVFLHRMKNLTTNPNLPLRDSLRAANKRYLPLLITVILVMLIAMVAMLLALAVFSVFGKFLIFGTVFAVAAAIFVGILLIFAMPSVILDNLGPFAAIKTSFALVWKNWWHTVEGMYVPPLVISLLLLAMQLSLNKIAILVPVSAILGFLVHSLFLNPYIFALLLVQMNDLKIRKAEKDLIAEQRKKPNPTLQ